MNHRSARKPGGGRGWIFFIGVGVRSVGIIRQAANRAPGDSHMRALLTVMIVVGSGSLLSGEPGKALTLELRSRVQAFKPTGEWQEVTFRKELAGAECAIVICDMWDKHWCDNATERCGGIARRMEPMLQAARAKGVTIIHAPSD